jgi:hypothetical protein
LPESYNKDLNHPMDISNKMQEQAKWLVLAALVLTLFGFSKAHAQNIDRFNFYYDELGASNDVVTSNFSTQVGHQMFLDEEGSNLLTMGLQYGEVTLVDDEATGVDSGRVLKSIMPEFNLMRILNEKYSLIVNARPGFYGDLKGDLGNDFRLEGGVVVTRLMSDSLTLGLGLGRGGNFGRDLVWPLVQFLWFASDEILVRGLLPSRASVWYIPSQDWEFGGLFRLSGSLYTIEDTGVPEATKLGFATVNVGAAVRRRVYEKGWAVLEAGYTVMRRYEWSNPQGPSFVTADDPDVDKDLNGVPYVRIGLQHRL